MYTRIKNLAVPLAVVAALALGAVATPASAQDTGIRVYKVTADGAGSFTYDLDLPLGDGMGTTIHREVGFGWHVELPWVAFLSNGEAVLAGQGAAQGTIAGNGTEDTTIVGSDGHGGKVTTHGFCKADDQTHAPSGAMIMPDKMTADPNAGGTNITLRPLSAAVVDANCTAAVYGGHGSLTADVAPEQFDQRFFLPQEATRQGKIIQLVESSPQQKDKCADTVSLGTCEFHWSGTVTFEFQGYLGGGEITEDDLPELPAGGGAQQGGQQDQSLDDLLVPLPSGAKLSKSGTTASMNVTCASACSGVVSAFPAKGASAAAAKPLAKKRFKAAAGKRVKVTLRFRGAALRKVRKAKAVRLVASVGKSRRSLVARTH